MSLLVHAFIYNEDGEMQFVEKEHSSELAGFESCRKHLYGSAVSNELDLVLLPSLATESSLFVCFDDLQKLKQEIELMFSSLDLYEEAGIYKRDYIEARLNNILGAIRDALKIKGQIVIW